MTVDIEKLEALAKGCRDEVIRSHGWAGMIDDADLLRRDEEFLKECSPDAVLELTQTIRDLQSSVQGLKTGYEAYERVNAELKAENEALKKRLAPVDNFNRQQVPVIGYTGCLVCGQFTDHGGLPCPKTSATAWASASKEQSHD